MSVAELDLDRELAAYRRELTGYCYRMLGSGFEAEDAVQETLLRAWKAADGFEGRSSVRSWLYRIATNVCLDMLRAPQRRAMAMDLTAPWSADTPLPAPAPETEWVSPIADDRVLPPEADPAELASLRDSVRLAFVAALQHLPPATARGADPARGAEVAGRRGRRAVRDQRRVREQPAPARPRHPRRAADGRARAG